MSDFLKLDIHQLKRVFECGRNFQLTGENNFFELYDDLCNESEKISDVKVTGLLNDLKRLKLINEDDNLDLTEIILKWEYEGRAKLVKFVKKDTNERG